LRTVEEIVALEPGPWVISTSAESVIRVSTAIRRHRRLAFDYQSHNGVSSRRELEPYGLIHMDGRWYMAGHCLLRQSIRTFRLDRVSRLELAEDTFERPASFDIRAYLHRSMPFVQSAFTIEVWLEMSANEASSHFALHRVVLQEENGGATVRCGRDNLETFAAMLLSLGCRIVVHHPQELKDAFATLAERAMQAAASGRV
jgi:predicted DNA-binding transcriptional regulator YafY